MTDRAQLLSELQLLRAQLSLAEVECEDRPEFSFSLALHGKSFTELQAEQRAWDEAHPDAAALWKSTAGHEDRIEELEDKLRVLDLADDRRARVLELLDSPRLSALVTSELQQTEALRAVADWDRRRGAWCLLLIGGVGCGKSTAAASHFVEVGVRWLEIGASLSSRARPIWARASEEAGRSAFGAEADVRRDAFRRSCLLVLDDLGVEMSTNPWSQLVDDVMDYRYQHSGRTVITSNLDPNAFKARYGERISDRIRQDGMVRQLSGRSMRKP